MISQRRGTWNWGRKLPWALVGVIILAATSVRAGGLEYGPQGLHALGRGGAFTAKADDASAFYWNPSRLSLQRGTQVLYNHSFTSQHLTFERNPAIIEDPVMQEQKTVTFPVAEQQEGPFPLGISFGVVSDLGLQDFAFAFGLVGPAAVGRATQGEGDGSSTRYSFLSSDVAIVYLTAAAAWKYQERFGLGLALQYVNMPWLRYSLDLVAPGGPSATTGADQTLNDLRAEVDVSDPVGFSALASGWVRPTRRLELGLTSRVMPIRFAAEGHIEMAGTPNSVYAQADPFQVPARLSFTLPRTVALGLRYLHPRTPGALPDEAAPANHAWATDELFDLELGVSWEQWSALDRFQMELLQEELDSFGATIKLKQIDLVRNLEDSWTFRLGGQWQVLPPWLVVRAGGWYETASQPVAYTVTDYPAFARVGLAAGCSVYWRGYELGIAYGHVFQLERNVSAGEGRIYQQLMQLDGTIKEGFVVNEGRYTGSFDTLSVGVSGRFGG